jgi:outer membrane protein assembly factor BamE (lipoprotein component of BamABCDE complex)
MNRLCTVLTIIIVLFMSVGCATTGTKKIEGVAYDKIVEGITSKARVVELLGNPFNISISQDGKELYTYTFARSSPAARNFIPVVGLFSSKVKTDTQTVSILFNNKGIVEKKVMNNAETELKSGIAE